jgi:hypothetical protein
VRPIETELESQLDAAPSGAQEIVVQSANPMAGAMGYTTAPASRANTISETVLIFAPMGRMPGVRFCVVGAGLALPV